MALPVDSNAEFVTALATSGLTLVAVFALVVAFRQIRVSQRSAREATARAIWHDYEKLCFEHPMFANTDLLGADAIKFDEGQINRDPVLFEKYQWFVTVMLGACDEMLHSFRKEEDWKRYLTHHLEYHKLYLKSRSFEPLRSEISERLKNMIDQLF